MNNFYVYMYLRSKKSKHGEAGTPYYVGKGKKMRAYSKDHRVRPPVNLAMIVFVARGLSEDDANKMEMGLIARHGRIDKGTGCLRNLTDGGIQHWKEKNAGDKGKNVCCTKRPFSKRRTTCQTFRIFQR